MYKEIGKKLKTLRTEKNMTLKTLSAQTNLSMGFLSQLERGITSVAIDSLATIASVLGVGINYFFGDEPAQTSSRGTIIVRSFEREVAFLGENYIQYMLSADIAEKTMFPRMIELLPRAKAERPLNYRHEGEEVIYVIEGILTFHHKTECYEVYPGDCIHFCSSDPHNWENNTNNIVKILVVSTPNHFREAEHV